MNKQRLAILIIAGLGAMTKFTTWVKYPTIKQLEEDPDQWLILLLFAVPLIISLLKDKTKTLLRFQATERCQI